MKTLRLFLLLAAALIGLSVPVQAQTVATTTTLAANMTATDTVATVTSASGFTVGDFLYIDAEQMRITAISGTAISVQRGVNGTAARAHDNAERIIEGPADHFHTNPPDYGQDCTRGSGQAAFSPWIDVRGQPGGLGPAIWMCGGSGQNGQSGLSWTATTTAPLTLGSIPTSF